MSTEDENQNPSKTPLIVAIASLVLAIIAFGVAVALALPILRKSYSVTPTTSIVPIAPSLAQSLPSRESVRSPTTINNNG